MNIVKGDLLTAKGIIVHGCNCQGVMGSGVALQIKTKWPAAFEKYMEHHRLQRLYLGSAHYIAVEDDVIVVNAMTQRFYGRDGRRYVDYDAVGAVFRFVRGLAKHHNLPVHFPLIGCGLAGGDWSVVEPIIHEQLGPNVEATLWLHN